MATNIKTRTLVRGVSAKILENYDKFHAALDKMEKYHQISNDFQVMAFTKVAKEALDNVVDMFEDEDAKKQIRAQIAILKAQSRGGEANVFRGSSRPSSNRFYKYMFIAKVNYDGTVNFSLCSLEKKANFDVMKGLTEACSNASDALISICSLALLGELVKEGIMAWGRVFGIVGPKLQELTMAEFITEFDMTQRLIDGKYCELDKEKNELYLLE